MRDAVSHFYYWSDGGVVKVFVSKWKYHLFQITTWEKILIKNCQLIAMLDIYKSSYLRQSWKEIYTKKVFQNWLWNSAESTTELRISNQ